MVRFTLDQLNENIERAKVLDPGWYGATILSPINCKPDSKGNPLYVARVQIDGGKIIFCNFSASGAGVNFWIPAMAAANEMTLSAYQDHLKSLMDSSGWIDFESLLLDIAGKKVQVFLKVKEYKDVISNEIEKWKSIDA